MFFRHFDVYSGSRCFFKRSFSIHSDLVGKHMSTAAAIPAPASLDPANPIEHQHLLEDALSKMGRRRQEERQNMHPECCGCRCRSKSRVWLRVLRSLILLGALAAELSVMLIPASLEVREPKHTTHLNPQDRFMARSNSVLVDPPAALRIDHDTHDQDRLPVRHLYYDRSSRFQLRQRLVPQPYGLEPLACAQGDVWRHLV